jgi:2,4-dienoyl-CoA reductase (NADPH2)
VAPSAIKSPLSSATPREMSETDILQTIEDYAQAACLAQDAGYDGVEVMGAEGYLINQFAVPRTNQRADEWGGSTANRARFATEVVRRVHQRTGSSFLLIYRLSMLDLVEGGGTWDEITFMAREIEAAGASIVNPYVGWHEARVPTIATMVPRAAFVTLTARLKKELKFPVVASNRINDPSVAEEILARGDADLVSMARPLLADPDFVKKAISGRALEINTCIACNQACLDQAFAGRVSSCLVNPFACNETELLITATVQKKRVAVVGAGPAGMACASTAAERGHEVTLFDSGSKIGGQFNLARKIPGKEEFAESLRFYRNRLANANVRMELGRRVSAADLVRSHFDEVVLATGVTPRVRDLPGVDHPKVVSYIDIIEGKKSRVLASRSSARVASGSMSQSFSLILNTERTTPPGNSRRSGELIFPLTIVVVSSLSARSSRVAKCGCCNAAQSELGKVSRRRQAGSDVRCSVGAACT